MLLLVWWWLVEDRFIGGQDGGEDVLVFLVRGILQERESVLVKFDVAGDCNGLGLRVVDDVARGEGTVS